MPKDSANLFLAIGLSLLVIIGWQYFYNGPKMEKARLAQIEAQKEALTTNPSSQPPNNLGSDSSLTPGLNAPPQGGVINESPNAKLSRAEALAATPRIKIDTQSLYGSISLKGARIDDVALKA